MSGRYVCFALGSIDYVLPVENVVQIVKQENILGVPDAPAFIRGVIGLRGEVVPVIDLGARLDIVRKEAGRKNRVIMAELSGRYCGLLVDEVREVIELEEQDTSEELETSLRGDLIKGVAVRAGESFLILDLGAVFQSGKQDRDAASGAAALENEEPA